MKPAIQSLAPDFTAPAVSHEGIQMMTLHELRGKKVVLVFYPKDNTPGCTTQACELRDHWAELKTKALIFGVSIDSKKSHLSFIEKQALPYPLLIDENKSIVEAYGVWVEKMVYGKTLFGTERSTFIIDETGKISAILEKVSPAKHLELLMEALI